MRTARATFDIPTYGFIVITTAALDAALARYLPASPSELRALCEDRSDCDLSAVYDVCTFVAMLADWDYNVDSSPLSVDATR